MNDRPNQPDTREDERELIESFRKGNIRAFDRLVGAHRDRVFGLCLRILGDYDDADECAQETFVKMYNGIDSFRMESSLSTWLYRIAVNTCKNRIASRKARNRHLDSGADPEPAPGNPGLGDLSFEPACLFERSERQRRITQAIALLPEKERIAVVLKDIEGKTYEEIEEITGIKEGTVKSSLSRARKFLRNELKDVFP
ncbi:MAG TPA: sigma-70 family RNA polymerase sigma factor [Spirochaetota bacterium]|nr:sigma-70 family RNA polymerase sigma factor [Spirochaetota bacterium]